MNRPRKVFGRRTVTTNDGKTFRIEMRGDGVYVKKLRSRKIGWSVISFERIVVNHLGQGLLPFV